MSVVDPKAVAAALKKSKGEDWSEHYTIDPIPQPHDGEERNEELTKAELAHFMKAKSLPELMHSVFGSQKVMPDDQYRASHIADAFMATDTISDGIGDDAEFGAFFHEAERDLIAKAVSAAVQPIVDQMTSAMMQMSQMNAQLHAEIVQLITAAMKGNIQAGHRYGMYPQPALSNTVGDNTVKPIVRGTVSRPTPLDIDER